MEQPLNTAVAILTALECQDEVGFYMVLDDLEPMEVYSSLVLMCRTLTEMISRRDGISEQEVLQLVARAAAECGG